MFERQQDQERRAWDRTAWQTAHLLNAWGRRRYTASKLLGRPMTGERPELNREQREAAFSQVWANVERLRRQGRLLPAEDAPASIPAAFPLTP